MAKHPKTGAVGGTAVRTAELLIERHGAGARDFVRQHLTRLEAAGTADSAADWAEVLRAIDELTRRQKKS
jgi:hypothetical protein